MPGRKRARRRQRRGRPRDGRRQGDREAAGRGPVTNPPPERCEQRWKRLLTLAAENPASVLTDPRCLKPSFCESFFDLCDGKALEEPDAALEYAEVAVELAKKTGDQHLLHRSQGVAVHAHIGRGDWTAARQLLEEYQSAALGCCAGCSSNWSRRHADLLVETRDAVGACLELENALIEMGDEADDDTLARIRFLRGIAHHFLADRDLALADAGRTLQELALSSPRGYFLDTLALLACFLQGGERRHDELALEHLNRFKKRIKGQKAWKEVRLRLSWVEGQLLARLGEVRGAMDRLDRVRQVFVDAAPARHLVAVTADLGQIYARRCHDANLRALLRILGTCARRRDLEKDLRRLLDWAKRQVSRAPESAPRVCSAVRTAFIVPVPGLLVERV